MADIKLSQLLAASPASVAAGAALWTHKGHIQGLALEWVSATSLRAATGSAWIESLGYAVAVNSAITKSSLSLAANTWFHVYLFMNAGVPDIEIVTTAPAAAYSGSARSKTGDNTRRYLGSVRTNASGQIINFAMNGQTVIYLADCTLTPFRVLSNGTVHTGWTQVDFSAVVPVTSRTAYGNAQNLAPTGGVNVGSDSAGNGFVYVINPAQSFAAFWPLDASQRAYYDYLTASPPTTGLYWDVWGYTFER